MGGLQHWRGDLRYRQFFVARQDVCRRQLNEKRVIHRGQWKFITRTSSAFLINWATMSNTRKCVGLLQNYFWIAYLPMWENQSKPRFISLLRSRHATLLLLLCWKVFFFFKEKYTKIFLLFNLFWLAREAVLHSNITKFKQRLISVKLANGYLRSSFPPLTIVHQSIFDTPGCLRDDKMR